MTALKEKNPFKVERKFTADYSDVEAFISQAFPDMPCYEIPCYEEKSNDCVMEVSVGKFTFSEYSQKELQKCLDDKKWSNYMLDNILEYLHSVGVLESGEYLIEISW